MRREFWVAVAAGCLWAGAQGLSAQAPANNKPAPGEPKPAQTKPAESNPFPEDTTTVPVLPSNASALAAPSPDAAEGAHVRLPSTDLDPVRSPDDATTADNGSVSGFSSSTTGLDQLLQPPPDEGKPSKGSTVASMPVESAKDDISVGNYYMGTKNWRGALSRFESALVLSPQDPDVFWGLAECQRHLGQYVAARVNYLKVMEYDPDSKRSKDAKKYLKQPELANAKGGASAPSKQ